MSSADLNSFARSWVQRLDQEQPGASKQFAYVPVFVVEVCSRLGWSEDEMLAARQQVEVAFVRDVNPALASANSEEAVALDPQKQRLVESIRRAILINRFENLEPELQAHCEAVANLMQPL